MSTPIKLWKPGLSAVEVLRLVVGEKIEATSSLHMRPEPIPESEQTPDNNGYLSDTDAWVKHAVEHLDNLSDLVISKLHEGSGKVNCLCSYHKSLKESGR